MLAKLIRFGSPIVAAIGVVVALLGPSVASAGSRAFECEPSLQQACAIIFAPFCTKTHCY